MPTTSPPPESRRLTPLPRQFTRWSTYKAYLTTPISSQHTEVPLLLCCLVSGLCDSSSFAVWQSFISMQTGNSIILCLGAANLPSGDSSDSYRWAKSLISIAAFIVGTFCWSRTKHCGPTTRITLSVSFFIQAIFIFVSAALVQSNVATSSPPFSSALNATTSQNFIERIPIALLSFQSSAQLVTAQLLHVTEIPTVVLTLIYNGLVSDTHFFEWKNVVRDRRLAALIFTFVGAIAGGWLVRSKAGIAGALWISGAIKVVIAVAWLLWKGRGQEEKGSAA